MNRPIIIQGALQSEIDYLLKIFQIENKTNFGGYVFYECMYKNYPIIISRWIILLTRLSLSQFYLTLN